MAEKVSVEKQPVKRTTVKETGVAPKREFVFGRENYILMLIGIAVLAVGYALMYGPSDGDIFEFRRITLGPVLVIAGFIIEVFAIFKKPKD
jgi:hypothetical protein